MCRFCVDRVEREQKLGEGPVSADPKAKQRWGNAVDLAFAEAWRQGLIEPVYDDAGNPVLRNGKQLWRVVAAPWQLEHSPWVTDE